MRALRSMFVAQSLLADEEDALHSRQINEQTVTKFFAKSVLANG